MTTWIEMWDRKQAWLVTEIAEQNDEKYSKSKSFLGRFQFNIPDKNIDIPPSYNDQKTLLFELEKTGVVKIIKIHDPETVLKRIYPRRSIKNVPLHYELGNDPFFASIKILQPQFEKRKIVASKYLQKYETQKEKRKDDTKNKIEIFIDSQKGIYRELHGKKLIYEIKNDGKRFKLIEYLLSHKGPAHLKNIRVYTKNRSEKTVAKEIVKINERFSNSLKITSEKELICHSKTNGYFINTEDFLITR